MIAFSTRTRFWCGVVGSLAVFSACNGGNKQSTDSGVDGDSGVPMTRVDDHDAGIPISEVVPTRTVPVKDEAVTGAQHIRDRIAGASVYFSLRTGHIARIDSAGLSGLDDTMLSPPEPLVERRAPERLGEQSAMIEFMQRFGFIWGLSDVQNELQNPSDPINDRIELPQEQFSNRDLPQLNGLHVRRLTQTMYGVPIAGTHVIGHFDGQGGLQSISTRLVKIDSSFDTSPVFTGDQLWTERFSQTIRDAAIAKNPALSWMAALTSLTPEIDHAAALEIEMVTPGGVPDSADPLAMPRLVYRLEVRSRGGQAMLFVDAKSGALIDAIDIMPSDWTNEGTLGLAGSNDETGSRYILFLNTVFKANRYMAMTVNNDIPSWLNAGNFVAISDTTGRADMTLTYFDPMKISTSVNGVDNYWYNDASYTAGKRQASALMSSITSTFDYWSNRRSWRGWDGQGSSFWASIFNDKNGSATTELNAWGGNGIIQIGDGTTSTGQYCGASKEIMGHELTHNVISATTKLEYLNESGAVNEALADFFGVAITANRAANDYASDFIGDDVGWSLRNMNNPPDRGQPDSYANYVSVPATSDSGGVHTNSGIINKAHTLLVKGGKFGLINVPRVGLERVEQILWASMRFKSYGEKATMEEFANGVLSICSVTDGFNKLFGDTSYAATCSAFRKAYRAVGVLPFSFAEMELKAVRANAGLLSAIIANNSGKSVSELSKKTSFVLTDKATGTKTTVKPKLVESEDDRSPVSDLLGGSHVRVTLDLPSDAMSPSQSKRNYDVEMLIEGYDAAGSLLHRKASAVLASDFIPERVTVTPPIGSANTIQTTVSNANATGFPSGLEGRLLARYGKYSSFMTFDGLTGSVALSAAQSGARPTPLMNVTTGSGHFSFANGLPELYVPSATPIVGKPGKFEVWFDVEGGLAELNDQFQLYYLVDSNDLVDEANETNNLQCVNCRAPGQALGETGVIVRLQSGTQISTLFEGNLQAAAAKLVAPYPRNFEIKNVQKTRLPYRRAGMGSIAPE